MSTNPLINSVEHSPAWKATGSSVTLEIHHVLCNPHVHSHVHNSPYHKPHSYSCLSTVPTRTMYAHLPIHATSPAHLILDLIAEEFAEQYKSWSSSLCNFLQSPVTFFPLGVPPYSQTPSVYVLPLLWQTKFHTHIIATRDKIIALYTLLFLDSKQEDKVYEWNASRTSHNVMSSHFFCMQFWFVSVILKHLNSLNIFKGCVSYLYI
jgi:hypothetical protein